MLFVYFLRDHRDDPGNSAYFSTLEGAKYTAEITYEDSRLNKEGLRWRKATIKTKNKFHATWEGLVLQKDMTEVVAWRVDQIPVNEVSPGMKLSEINKELF